MNNDWEGIPEGGIFQRVAKLAGIQPQEWLAINESVPNYPENFYLLGQLIRLSARTETVLLCFDDHVFLWHDGKFSFKMTAMTTRHSGERIKGKNEVVDPSAWLNCEELRSIFVTLEALVYKCVHLKLKHQEASYTQRCELYEKRLDRLVDAQLFTKADKTLAIELYKTRNQFAHSLQSVQNITYLSERLEDRWGASGISNSREFQRYFLHDAYLYSEKLLSIFKPVQAEQLDGAIFRSELFAKCESPHDSGMQGRVCR